METDGFCFYSRALPGKSRRMNRAVFLDRDGTIIAEKHYLHKPEEVEIYPGAAKALKRLQDAASSCSSSPTSRASGAAISRWRTWTR